MRKFIVGITGASGVIYGTRLIEVLLESGHYIDVVITSAGRKVLLDESAIKLEGPVKDQQTQLLDYLNKKDAPLALHDIQDIGAVIASGSYRVDAMIVVPCSMGTLAAIAGGLSSNLLQRASDVTLKEGRKLLLVPRETPLSTIHLENMLKLSRLGVKIIPPVPAFYIQPKNIGDLVDFVVGRILDQLEIIHNLYTRWENVKMQ
ncbi:MAG: UbiX family flavin prenyltransferase [Firmicutes bacterium]|nr:UbiX family flavin prenyltransferase [Bacillota bacterium]